MAKKKRYPEPEPEPEPVYKVGDRVRFPFGSGEAVGTVVEDRGCLGVGGRRLYGIKFLVEPGDLLYVELGESEMTPIPNAGRCDGPGAAHGAEQAATAPFQVPRRRVGARLSPDNCGPGAKKQRFREPAPAFKVGDRVKFLFGSGEVSGTIVEDRGCLGAGGRRLYGINTEFHNPDEIRYTEMPEVELTGVPQGA